MPGQPTSRRISKLFEKGDSHQSHPSSINHRSFDGGSLRVEPRFKSSRFVAARSGVPGGADP
jgi:hypothetical protein